MSSAPSIRARRRPTASPATSDRKRTAILDKFEQKNGTLARRLVGYADQPSRGGLCPLVWAMVRISTSSDRTRAAAMARAVDLYGRIDILVNNVGGTTWAKPYEFYRPQDIEAEVRRSLFPTLYCCRAALDHMLPAGRGVIVNVSSIATRSLNRVPYAAAKAGVNAITASRAGVTLPVGGGDLG